MRFEPTTFTLASCEHRTEVVQSQGVTGVIAAACTNACTNSPELMQSESKTRPHDGPSGERFAEAVAMIARLPLTDAERAEAVRRLLAPAGETPAREQTEPTR